MRQGAESGSVWSQSGRYRPVLRLLLPVFTLWSLAACSNNGAGTLSTAPPGLNVARAALDGGAPEVALRIATAAVAAKPDDLDALIVQADADAALDMRPEADTAYRRVLALKPDSVEARMGLGRLSLADNPAAAEAMFLDVLARDPRNAKALNDLGIARDLQGRHTDAQAAYRQALGIVPEMQAATTNLALSLALSRRAEDGGPTPAPLPPRPRPSRATVAERNSAPKPLVPDIPPAQRLNGETPAVSPQ